MYALSAKSDDPFTFETTRQGRPRCDIDAGRSQTQDPDQTPRPKTQTPTGGSAVHSKVTIAKLPAATLN